MKKSKKILAVLTAATVAMTLTMPVMIPAGSGLTAVYAAETDLQGRCGDNATFKYDAKTKTMTVSGSGEMWNDAGFAKGLYNAENIIIEEGITVIGEYSFEELNNVKSVTLPKTVTTIKKGAFGEIQGTVEIPETIKKIETFAFNGAKKFVIKGDAVGFEASSLGGGIEEVEICGNGTDLGMALIDNGVTNVKINNSNDKCKISNGCIVSSDGKTLYYCITDKEEITISDTVETVSPAAMYGRYIRKLTLGKNVRTVGEYAFQRTYMRKLVINKNLRRIGRHAFVRCTFENVKLNGKVSLGIRAFDSYVKLSNSKKFKNNRVAIESAKLYKKKMTLKFTKIYGAKGYQIKVKKGKKSYIYTTTKNKFKKTLPKKVYGNYTVKKSYNIIEYNTDKLSGAAYVTVRPYKIIKKKKAYGAWSTKIVLSK